MRGVYTSLAQIRRTVFCEVARLAYESQSGDYGWVDELPYEIIPGDVATYRESVFLERAIVGERIRLAMGLPLQGVGQAREAVRGRGRGCQAGDLLPAAADQRHQVRLQRLRGELLQGERCVPGLPGSPVPRDLPKGAITFKDKKAYIDQEKCIKCGRCASVCPYGAIQHHERRAPLLRYERHQL